MGSPLMKHRFHFCGTENHGLSRPHHSQNHFHGFLDKEYPSRRKPLPSGVCRNSTLSAPTRSSYSGDQLCLLSRRNLKDRSPENLEKNESFSLKLFFPLSHPSLSLSFSFSPKQLGEDSGQVGCHLTCHMSISNWPPWITPYPLSI